MSEVKWTNEQLQAINEDRNNVLVAAAAGSGKTAVLVERIINKIVNKNVDIDKLLVVTFTNAAASEMRERVLEAIYKKLEENPEDDNLLRQINLLSRASICTIDSFCLDVVRNNFYEIGISPNFRIADSTELELLKQETIEDLFEEKYEVNDEKFLKLLETYSSYISDDSLKNLVLEIYNFIQSSPFPKDWLEDKVEDFNIKDELNQDFSNTKWGKIIIENIKENVLDCKLRLEEVSKEISSFEELGKYINVIQLDIYSMNEILNSNTWDEMCNAINDVSFEKWPVDKKITLEEKNIAKDKRDRIKKQFNKAVEIINCNSNDANLDIYEMYEILNSLKQLVFEFEEKFSNNKSEKNIVDFNDIEHFALNILLKKDESGEYKPTEVAKKYRNKFIEIAIDEYQDSNLVQEYILKSISNGKNIFMVGDVKQSIYKFRQACPDLFIAKYENYEKVSENQDANNLNGIKIQLFKNFRSRENILDTTNIIFENIMSKELGDIDYNEDEYLNLGAKFEETEQELIKENTEIDIIENSNEGEDEISEEPIENIELEAKYVAKRIKELIDSKRVIFDKKEGYRPITYKDIVILLRATKERANVFEKEISKLNMPVFSDTSSEYLDSIEIQIIMNLLKIIDNPMQDIPLVAVLRSFIGAFTDNELVKIRVETNKNKTFYDSMKEYVENLQSDYADNGQTASLPKEAKNDTSLLNGSDEEADGVLKNKIQIFFSKIHRWQDEKEYLNLDELIWKIYEDTGFYNYVGLMPNGSLRQANLRSLFEKAREYERASFKGLYNFINFIDRLKTTSGDLSSAKLIGENDNVIRIMSIHKSKGLEFPVVFLCGSNKQFNMQDLHTPVLLHQNIGIGVNYIDSERKLQYSTLSKEAIKIKSKEELLSEEMRVLYVALTRAKERLIITGVSKDSEKDLKEKEEILKSYKDKKINKNILKKYKSYLDWIELVSIKNKDNKNLKLNFISKEDAECDYTIEENKEKEETKTIKELEKTAKSIENRDNQNRLKEVLEWKYKDIDASKIETKTSVSKIKMQSIGEESNIINLNVPKFLKKEEKISGSRKGSIIHLCMQKLNPQEEYTIQKIESILDELVLKNIITMSEKESINIKKIYAFTKSKIWDELKFASVIEKEKPFYINIPAKDIYETSIEEDILVQGIIDLYYINKENELVLVDYKTDYIQKEEELVEKYKVQLDLYKTALEEALQRKVDKIYIYSTYLDKVLIVTI